MSWQAFVDTQLVASNHVTKAAIIGNVDGQVWASTPDFFVSLSIFTFLFRPCPAFKESLLSVEPQPRGYPATIAKDDGSEVEETVNEAAILVQIMQTGKNHPQGLRMNGDKYQFIRGETDPNVVVTGKKASCFS